MQQVISDYVTSTNTSDYTYQRVEHIQDVSSALRVVSETRTPQVALVAIMHYFAARERSQAIEQSLHYFLTQIRPLTRRSDIVLLYRHTAYFILPGANLQGAKIVQERLWDALTWRLHHTDGEAVTRPWNLVIGYSAYPDPSVSVQECITASNEAQNSLSLQREYAISTDLEPVMSLEDADLPILARKLGIPFLPSLPRQIAPHIKQMISPELAQELFCYPLGCERNTLTIAMANPQDQQALTRLRQVTGMRIFPVLISFQELQTAFRQL